MLRALDMLKKRSNIIVGAARDRSAQIARLHAKRSDPLGVRAQCERSTQMIVDDRFERPPCATCLRLEACGHIIFERKSSSHIVMLSLRHHDV
jgi:hypothetical protein